MKVFICVDNSGADKCLTLGKTYVGEYSGRRVRTMDDRGLYIDFFARRFEETSPLSIEELL